MDYCWLIERANGDSYVVGTDRVYTPDSSTVGCRLKLRCTAYRNESGSPLTSELNGCVRTPGREVVYYLSGVISPSPALPSSVQRRMNSCLAAEKSFRVMTYNILADIYATTTYAIHELFNYVRDVKYLDQDYRAQLVQRELEASHADIICLQEVDYKLFQHYLMPYYSKLGFMGGMSPYTCRYTNKNSGTSEGCATFIRDSRFHVIFELDVPLAYAVLADTSFEAFLRENPEAADILGIL